MNFSVNQARHLYVANALADDVIKPTDGEGTILVKADKNKQHLYFQYKGALGNLMRSDLIDVKNILYATATPAKSMGHVLKTLEVQLNPEVNNGEPVASQDYILRIGFTQFAGMSDQDTYNKFGEVHATKDMTPSEFYARMALSLAVNFSKEITPLIKITLVGQNPIEVTANTKLEDLTGTYIGFTIQEVPQDWRLGVKEQVPVYFEIYGSHITAEGDEVNWAAITNITPTLAQADEGTYIGNGKKIADLEYFCMGERGDMYRQIAWPHNLDTKYLVDPTKEYDVLDIHYCHVGSGEGPQRSEKTITIVAEKDTIMGPIIAVIKANAGIAITF